MQSVKCKCEAWSARCTWSVKKVFSWPCSATWPHAGHVPGRKQGSETPRTQRAALAWLAHGARKFYRCERSNDKSLRQLPLSVMFIRMQIHIRGHMCVNPPSPAATGSPSRCPGSGSGSLPPARRRGTAEMKNLTNVAWISLENWKLAMVNQHFHRDIIYGHVEWMIFYSYF